MRKWLVVLLVIGILAAAAWYFLTFRLDGLIADEIEHSGSQALGTQVQVAGVKTRLADGQALISGLTVANPSGYKNPHALNFTGIDVQVDYENFDVRKVVISEPVIIAEAVGLKNNFNDLLEGIEAAASSAPASSSGDVNQELTIHQLEIQAATAILDSDLLDEPAEFKVDRIVMTGLKGSSEEIAAVVAEKVIREIRRETLKAIAKAEAGKQIDRLKEKLGDLIGN